MIALYLVTAGAAAAAGVSGQLRGYREDHSAARWLRYRSFTASRMLTEREVQSPRLPEMLAGDFEQLGPGGDRPAARRLAQPRPRPGAIIALSPAVPA